MISPKKGNLLLADAEALVNTVNCVGIMGRGVAAQFKDAFPLNFKAYKRACDLGEVLPGKMFIFETGSLTNPKYIINFPTKRHWKGKSRIEDIETGLEDLRAHILAKDIRSIAIPPLGSGLGGLNWSDVRPLILKALSDIDSLEVLLYEPIEELTQTSKAVNQTIPNWTVGRALMVALMDRYQRAILDPSTTLLEVHKLLYLAQAAGQPLKLKFAKAHYGPYGENIRHVLKATEGYFTQGYDGEADNPTKNVSVVPGAVKEANEFLANHEDALGILDQVSDLVDGWETPYGLELLTTVHWIFENESPLSLADVIAKTYSWNENKKKFTERQIRLAYEQLAATKWVASITTT